MAGDIGVWTIGIPLAALGITIVGGILRVAHFVSKFETDIEKIRTNGAERRLEIDDRITKLERECTELITQAERRCGETVAAVRQKINDVELWTRDNLVNNKTFSTAMMGIEADFKAIGTRLEAGFDRIEAKFDRGNQRDRDRE